MRDALRTCLQIAGGLTEATRRRTVDAARELLDQTGIDVDAVQRRIGSAIPAEVQTLADELMAAGRANRDLLRRPRSARRSTRRWAGSAGSPTR